MVKFDDDDDACGKHKVAAQSREGGAEGERERDWEVFDGRKKQMEGGVEIGGGVLKKLAATLTNGLLLLFNKGRATQMCFLNLIPNNEFL